MTDTGPATINRRVPRPEVRDRLLRAASTVFAERGFAGASMHQVAAAAGFTTGALYSNFANKDDLFFAIFDREVAGRIHDVRAIVEKVDHPLDEHKALAIGDRLTAAMRLNREWQLLFTEFWLRAARDPDLRKRWVAQRREYRRQLTELAEELLPPSLDALPARTIVFTLVALNNGLAIEELADPGSVPADTIGQVLVRIIGLTPT